MNKHFFSIKNIVNKLFLSGIIVFITLPVFANNKKTVEVANQVQPSLQVIESDASSTLLSLQYDAESPVKFDVIIRDEYGNLLYRKNYESSKFFKQFKLVNETGESSSNLFVTIKLADGKQFNYTVNNTVDIVKEILVNKL